MQPAPPCPLLFFINGSPLQHWHADTSMDATQHTNNSCYERSFTHKNFISCYSCERPASVRCVHYTHQYGRVETRNGCCDERHHTPNNNESLLTGSGNAGRNRWILMVNTQVMCKIMETLENKGIKCLCRLH